MRNVVCTKQDDGTFAAFADGIAAGAVGSTEVEAAADLGDLLVDFVRGHRETIERLGAKLDALGVEWRELPGTVAP